MEEEYIKKIERLNLDIINLKNSKEYLLGKKIIMMVNYIKKFKFLDLIKKMIETKKIKKYNAHEELENNYESKELITIKKKIAVYTCITGNYDKFVQEPFVQISNIDFYLYTDNLNIKSKNWIIREIPDKLNKYNNILKNRYIKMHPKELFPDYDYAVYIDGNVKVMSNLTDMITTIKPETGISMHRHQFRDCIYKEIEVCRIRKKGNYIKMKEQVEEYRKNGFPENFGMLEATIIFSDIKNENAKKLFDSWWEEFCKTESFRDQISLQYIIWKNHLKINDFGSLGNNLYRNPKFQVYIHK